VNLWEDFHGPNAEYIVELSEIEQTIREFAQKAKDETLSLEERRGGTFTITNGGIFGSLSSTFIVNPRQVGILSLHKTERLRYSGFSSCIINSSMPG
jgi:2-oxoglutarate dehydrogenase E2 component (dihydrolipoamide succinyltransferase)